MLECNEIFGPTGTLAMWRSSHELQPQLCSRALRPLHNQATCAYKHARASSQDQRGRRHVLFPYWRSERFFPLSLPRVESRRKWSRKKPWRHVVNGKKRSPNSPWVVAIKDFATIHLMRSNHKNKLKQAQSNHKNRAITGIRDSKRHDGFVSVFRVPT